MGDTNEKERISGVLSPPAELLTNFDSTNQQRDSKESPSEFLPVRRSTRDIKRKKFDDELLVDSTLPSKSPFKKARLGAVSSVVVTPGGGEKVELKPHLLPPVSILSSSISSSTSGSIGISSVGILAAPVASASATATQGPKLVRADPQQLPSASTIQSPTMVATPLGQSNAKFGVPVGICANPAATGASSSSIQAPLVVPIVIDQNTSNIVSLPAAGNVEDLLALQPHPPLQTPTNGSAKKRGRQSKKSMSLTNTLEAQEKAVAMKDMGRWQPTDDLALITAVMQVNDLNAVYAGVKFSCKFTLEEIQARWYALLYDPLISKYAQEAMKLLPPEVISTVQSNTLFSREEEKILASISSAILTPTLTIFEELLNQHPDTFHFARTARSLMSHWQNMKEFRLLNDQKFPNNSSVDDGPTFSDIEDNFDDEPTPGLGDNICERELLLNERHLVRQIRKLENELPKWHVLVESVTGVATPDFDSNTIAALRGRMVRYLIRSREATIGRNAKGSEVDIDLSLEGPAFKISRKQGTIKLRATGDFYITNDGKRPFYVDGKPVLGGCKTKLNNNSVIEFACIRLIFMINQDLVQIVRNEGAKMMIA